MKSFSTPVTRSSRRPSVRARFLLQIDFVYPSAYTLRVSDEPVPAALGQEWLPFVRSWGNLSATLNTLDVDGRPATATIALLNTKPIAGRDRLSDLIRSPLNAGTSYEFAFATATIYELLDEALATEDAIRRGVFYLEEPTDIGEETLTLRMSDQSLVIENQLTVTRISKLLFPEAAPSAVGQSLKRPFGILQNVTAFPLVAGHVTSLESSIDSTQTSLTVVDVGTLHQGQTVQIEQEHITLGTLSERTFSGCTRHANATAAATHSDGVRVLGLLSQYRYAIGGGVPGHGLKAITNIRANGAPALTGPTVELDGQIVSEQGIGVITFTPADVVAFHEESKSITVAALGPISVNGGVNQATRTVTLPTTTEYDTRTINWTLTNSGSGSTNQWWVERRVSGGTWEIVESGVDLAAAASVTGSDSRLRDFVEEELRLRIFSTAGSAITFTMTVDSYVLTRSTQNADSTAEAAIGAVTCDIQGLRDDAQGSITGETHKLIENPADVVRFVLTRLYPGVSADDIGPSFATTRARAAGLRWAFLLGEERFSKLRRKFGEQARSVLYLDAGSWEFAYLQDAPTADLTLAYAKDVRIAAVKRSARTELVNRLTVYAARDFSASGALEDIYTHVQVHEDLAQGLARRSGATADDALAKTLELDLVQDTATAIALGDFWLSRWKRQRLELTVEAWHNVAALEIADHLSITGHPLLDNHGGATLVFRIVGVEDQPDEGTVRLTLVEANP